MPYRIRIEDMDGVPIGGTIRFGSGNTFTSGHFDVPKEGRDFDDALVQSSGFLEVASPGYYTVIMPVKDLFGYTHLRLHRKPNKLAWLVGGAVALGAVVWLLGRANKS
jgi:hypothetical protein